LAVFELLFANLT